jgi:dGTPase
MTAAAPWRDGNVLPDGRGREEEVLAPYAMHTRLSRGRRHPEPEHPYRSLYQRDRDRIVHSAAFRRLMYKTQVLVNQYSDHHRTRLTHTLEVTQISRTIARQLGLNEDLTEAIALAHDLGHPPFGHAGEATLDACMTEHGGFEHNRHGLRLVELLEQRYPDFPGLNLSFEVRESLAHHSKRPDAPEVKELIGLGQPFLEAQVVDAADSLAYDSHDVDDALSVGLITLEDLREVEMCRRVAERVHQRHGPLSSQHLQPAMIRGLIDWQVSDLLTHAQARLQDQKILDLAQVRQAPELLVVPGAEVTTLKGELEEFLHRRVYRHYRVMRMTGKARRFLLALFAEYTRSPEQLPDRYYLLIAEHGLHQTVCDYLASMTDRYAQDEYQRLYHPYVNG